MADAKPHLWARMTWRPGGRWERILAALYHRDLPRPHIRAATQTGKHPLLLECKKVKRALADMVRGGLIRRTGDLYEITALGSRTLHHGGTARHSNQDAQE